VSGQLLDATMPAGMALLLLCSAAFLGTMAAQWLLGAFTVGTRSVLYGAHCFLLHPWFVAWAWWRLYGFPWDPRLWAAFAVHDLGYWGKPNMDGPEGEAHPALGAVIMARLFDGRRVVPVAVGGRLLWLGNWGHFTLLHSRFLAKALRLQPSRLCIADKLAIALTPSWLYLPMVRATGELNEYMAHAKRHREAHMDGSEAAEVTSINARSWHAGVQSYCRRWALEHRDGKIDTWTPDARGRASISSDGVWR